MVLRAVPPVIRPFLNIMLPSSWKFAACISRGKKILAPEVRRRRHLEKTDPEYKKPNDLLQGMMDMAKSRDKDSRPEDLAHRQLVMSLTAVHSTATAAAHVLFDLTARPRFFEELREEVLRVLREGGWGKQSLNKLRKMDSFLK